MTNDLYVTHQGPPRSGEVIITAEEAGNPTDPFTRLARAVLAEIFELRTQMQEQRLITPDEQIRDRKAQQKEVERWRRANEELKRAAQDMAAQITRLEEDVDRLTNENESLRGQLNEAVLRTESMRARHRLPADEPGQYPLTELMSERAYNEWKRFMEERPSLRGED